MSNGDRFPANGPSPRLRGKLLKGAKTPAAKRSIPAPAGETASRPGRETPRTVHPRACGGNHFEWIGAGIVIGPSPRLRGKRLAPDDRFQPAGSIPAPAGETTSTGRRIACRRVHPRACGGNWRRRAARRRSQVHPRACGGNGRHLRLRRRVGGPSPRLRGKPYFGSPSNSSTGSIPAPAGETRPTPRRSPRRRVHPRACGGNKRKKAVSQYRNGPSPRLRGKHHLD